MLLFYIKTAWRNLQKHKLISLINIGGLAIGLSCSIFAIYYAFNELTYENCHEKADRISRVYTYGNFGALDKLPNTFINVANDLQTRYPEIETVSAGRSVMGIVRIDNKPVNQNNIIIADTAIYSILTLPFIYGKAPVTSNEIALSRKMARKFFGKDSPLGESIRIDIWGKAFDYTITGVFNDIPHNSHTQISCHIPFSIAEKLGFYLEDYGDADYTVYTLTKPGTDILAFNNKLAQDYKIPADIENVKVALVPIKRIHLHENISENSMANLLILLLGGMVALALSCISYINLNNIITTTRNKELGIRKSVGCGRKSITKMLLADSALTTAISLIIASVITIYLMPYFNDLLSKEINTEPTYSLLAFIFGIALLVSLVSGLIPAFSVRKAKPVNLMGTGSDKHVGKVKHSLLTLQFVVAIILLQFIIISNRQGEYMFSNEVVKCNADNVLVTSGWFWGELPKVKDELLKNSAIESVTWAGSMPGYGFNIVNNWKEKGNKEIAQFFTSAPDYTHVFKIKMLDGRFFSDDFQGDSKSVVINELTAQSLGLENPVGKTMLYNEEQRTIIGIIDSYQSVPVIFKNIPLIIDKAENYSHFLIIRPDPQRIAQAKEYINEVLSSINPNQPINLRFYNEMILEVGKSYKATEILMKVFTLVVIVNAMLGLFGLSLFISQFRNKEVGVRKVCGASNLNIIWKLSKGFAIQLLLALIIATPISIFAGQGYVSTFTNHISMKPDIFILGGSLASLMVILSAGIRIAFAARRNPVEVLRYE